MTIKKSLLLGELLIDKGLLTIEQLEKGLAEQKRTKEFLGTCLVRLGLLKEETFFPILAVQLNTEYVQLKDAQIDRAVIEKVPAKFACHYKLIPVRMDGDTLVIAVNNPLDIHTLDDIKLLLNCSVKAILAGEKDILEAIRTYYGIGADTLEKMMTEAGAQDDTKLDAEEARDIDELTEDASIINFVNQVLLQAYKDRATDVHIEPFENELKVRYRIDGILYDTTIPPTIKHFQSAIVSRIKIMAAMNIAERRLPQDGRIQLKVKGEELDLRVSILPTAYGETVDVRLLPTTMLFGLERLGLVKRDMELMERVIKRPHGIIFVTGPTGSGKTTTLYACLSKLNTAEKKIITIEDPVEYRMSGITQIQVLPKIGLDFAAGLRSMLRHDPDIMMVGEVRDYETVEITIRAALTGHLVFSTLHTNDAPGAITRLLDMGVEPFLASSAVVLIVAQRLVRLICPKCKKPMTLEKSVEKELGIPIGSTKGKKLYMGKGCESCKFTGYKGRTAIHEFLMMDDPIKDLVLNRASADQIRKKAVSMGMRTLRVDGWDKVLKGLTTPDEILRVTQQ